MVKGLGLKQTLNPKPPNPVIRSSSESYDSHKLLIVGVGVKMISLFGRLLLGDAHIKAMNSSLVSCWIRLRCFLVYPLVRNQMDRLGL